MGVRKVEVSYEYTALLHGGNSEYIETIKESQQLGAGIPCSSFVLAVKSTRTTDSARYKIAETTRVFDIVHIRNNMNL